MHGNHGLESQNRNNLLCAIYASFLPLAHVGGTFGLNLGYGLVCPWETSLQFHNGSHVVLKILSQDWQGQRLSQKQVGLLFVPQLWRKARCPHCACCF